MICTTTTMQTCVCHEFLTPCLVNMSRLSQSTVICERSHITGIIIDDNNNRFCWFFIFYFIEKVAPANWVGGAGQTPPPPGYGPAIFINSCHII